ncbi:hypothetical protein BDZ91DRAFT_718924 [Kalaharituber pfeilii]|nr:hypothetical protein BDZ91DRAFT_718924 [Kalaharituber pfeilii]
MSAHIQPKMVIKFSNTRAPRHSESEHMTSPTRMRSMRSSSAAVQRREAILLPTRTKTAIQLRPMPVPAVALVSAHTTTRMRMKSTRSSSARESPAPTPHQRHTSMPTVTRKKLQLKTTLVSGLTITPTKMPPTRSFSERVLRTHKRSPLPSISG